MIRQSYKKFWDTGKIMCQSLRATTVPSYPDSSKSSLLHGVYRLSQGDGSTVRKMRAFFIQQKPSPMQPPDGGFQTH